MQIGSPLKIIAQKPEHVGENIVLLRKEDSAIGYQAKSMMRRKNAKNGTESAISYIGKQRMGGWRIGIVNESDAQNSVLKRTQ